MSLSVGFSHFPPSLRRGQDVTSDVLQPTQNSSFISEQVNQIFGTETVTNQMTVSDNPTDYLLKTAAEITANRSEKEISLRENVPALKIPTCSIIDLNAKRYLKESTPDLMSALCSVLATDFENDDLGPINVDVKFIFRARTKTVQEAFRFRDYLKLECLSGKMIKFDLTSGKLEPFDINPFMQAQLSKGNGCSFFRVCVNQDAGIICFEEYVGPQQPDIQYIVSSKKGDPTVLLTREVKDTQSKRKFEWWAKGRKMKDSDELITAEGVINGNSMNRPLPPAYMFKILQREGMKGLQAALSSTNLEMGVNVNS